MVERNNPYWDGEREIFGENKEEEEGRDVVAIYLCQEFSNIWVTFVRRSKHERDFRDVVKLDKRRRH